MIEEKLEFQKITKRLYRAYSDKPLRFDLQHPKGCKKWELRIYSGSEPPGTLQRVHVLYETLLESKVALMYFLSRAPFHAKMKLEVE